MREDPHVVRIQVDCMQIRWEDLAGPDEDRDRWTAAWFLGLFAHDPEMAAAVMLYVDRWTAAFHAGQMEAFRDAASRPLLRLPLRPTTTDRLQPEEHA